MALISIIVPVKPGGYVAAFDSISQICFDKNLYEVLLAEGAAPSQQRNMAARAATGDLLYFIDDDSIINTENLKICEKIMYDSEVAVVGGPSLTPDSDNWIQKLFGVALSSLLGAGAVRNRYRVFGTVRETTEKELILCNLVIRRSVFLEMNGFNEGLYPNEENELLDRIKASGLKLVHVPQMSVLRSQRKTIKAFIRQMFAYGRGRGQQTLISGRFSLLSFIPMFFVIYLFILFLCLGNIYCYIPFILYFLVVMLFTFVEAFKYRSINLLLLIYIYPLMHCVNGVGLLTGLIGGMPSAVPDNDIQVTFVKKFGCIS